MMAILLFLYGLDHNLNTAHAQQFPGPISTSIGGAGAGGYNAPESILLNPAAVNLLTPMDADLIYQDGSVSSDVHKTGLGLLVTDNSEDVLFPGAIYYARGARKFYGQGAEEQLWSVVVGRSYNEQWHFGLRLSHLTSTISNNQQHKQFTPGLGVIFWPMKSLSIGFAYENMSQQKKKIPLAFRLVPEARLGVQYKPSELFGFFFDVSRREAENPDNKGVIHGGFQSTSNAWSVFRMGMKWDDYAKQNFFTVGAGFDGPRLKINYGLQKALKGTNGALHGVDFRVTF